MTRFTVGFIPESWAAVQAQVRYIADEQHAPENAARWFNRLLATVDSLEFMPERYQVDPAQTAARGTEVRRLVFERTYLLFYVIDHARLQVTIVLFTHGARRMP